MRLLFGQQRDEVERTIENAIARHIQPLKSTIVQERVARTQAISFIQTEIAELRMAFDAFSTNPSRHSWETPSDEVVVGGFGKTSKESSIHLVQTIIDDKPGEPQMMPEKT